LSPQLWREVDQVVEAAYWSADHAENVEAAHTRAAAIRERLEALRT
jgi:hypothetical protein